MYTTICKSHDIMDKLNDFIHDYDESLRMNIPHKLMLEKEIGFQQRKDGKYDVIREGEKIAVCDTVQDAAYIINAIQLFEMPEMRDEK